MSGLAIAASTGSETATGPGMNSRLLRIGKGVGVGAAAQTIAHRGAARRPPHCGISVPPPRLHVRPGRKAEKLVRSATPTLGVEQQVKIADDLGRGGPRGRIRAGDKTWSLVVGATGAEWDE